MNAVVLQSQRYGSDDRNIEESLDILLQRKSSLLHRHNHSDEVARASEARVTGKQIMALELLLMLNVNRCEQLRFAAMRAAATDHRSRSGLAAGPLQHNEATGAERQTSKKSLVLAPTWRRRVLTMELPSDKEKPHFRSLRRLLYRIRRPFSENPMIWNSKGKAHDETDTEPVLSVNARLNFSMPYRVLAFYVIAPVKDPSKAVHAHHSFLAERGMVGRVYISMDGINAQVSGTSDACEEYRSFVADEFKGSTKLIFKEDPVDELVFPKLRVKEKGLVPKPADGRVLDIHSRGEDVTPETWAAMLADNATSKHVLDVRKPYEWDVGRFDGASRPVLDNFAEFDAEAVGLPLDRALRKETPVMMYCTGGIRCEYFSARLKAEGFEKVYKLQGGIQHYGNVMTNKATSMTAPVTQGIAQTDTRSTLNSNTKNSSGDAPHWRGSLFVFDRRNTLSINNGDEEPIGICKHCGAKSDGLINCCNIDCNSMHIVCERCLLKWRGFCCDACMVAPRRRPLDLLAATEGGEIDFSQVISGTQGSRPGQNDTNKLVTFKPPNLPRKEYDADKHLPPRERISEKLAGAGDDSRM